MLPKWKQRKYILVLLFWVLSLYDVNEREVWSMALNDNIKKFREEKNLTQQQLADKLYVSRQTVCRWENGSRCPDLITAKKLALELDVSMDELISDDDVESKRVLDDKRAREFYYIAVAFLVFTVVLAFIAYFAQTKRAGILSLVGVICYVVCAFFAKPRYKRIEAKKYILTYIISRAVILIIVISVMVQTIKSL